MASSAADQGRELGAPFGSSLDLIAEIAGDLEARESNLRYLCEWFEASGRTTNLSTYAPRLGRVLCRLGRYEEAEQLARTGRDLGALDDVTTHVEWRCAQALVDSSRGQHVEAERLAREAVRLAFETDAPLLQGGVLCDLAEILAAGGRRDEAAVVIEQALDCYERKEVIPLARRVRERLAALELA